MKKIFTYKEDDKKAGYYDSLDDEYLAWSIGLTEECEVVFLDNADGQNTDIDHPGTYLVGTYLNGAALDEHSIGDDKLVGSEVIVFKITDGYMPGDLPSAVVTFSDRIWSLTIYNGWEVWATSPGLTARKFQLFTDFHDNEDAHWGIIKL